MEAPSTRPSSVRIGQCAATSARSRSSAPGDGSVATTSSPWARKCATQLAPMTPVPTTATRRTSLPLMMFSGWRRAATYGSSEVGSASTSRLATSSSWAPSRIFFTGSSSFFPVRFRGIAGTAVMVSGMCRGDSDVRSVVTMVRRSVVVQVGAGPELHVQQQLPVPAGRVLQVHHQAVDRRRAVPRRPGRTRRCPTGRRRGSGWRPTGRRSRSCRPRRTGSSRRAARSPGTRRNTLPGNGIRRRRPRSRPASTASAR